MKYRTTTFASAGSLDINEDNLAYRLYPDGGIWAAAEGYGASEAGEKASDKAVSAATETGVLPEEMSDEKFMQWVKTIDLSVKQTGGHSSVAAAVIKENRLRYFSAGNVQLFYFRGWSFSEKSQNGSEMWDRKRLEKVSMGGQGKRFFSSLIEPESDDAFVICTDGLWKYVNELEMLFDRLKSENDREWVNTMVKRAFMKIGSHKIKDNIAVIAVSVE